MQETRVQSLGWEDSLEKEMATHSGILAWRILWTEEPGGPRFIGTHRTWLKQLSTAPILSFTFSKLLSQTTLSSSFSYLLSVPSESPWLDHLSHNLLFASTSLKLLIGTRKAFSLDLHSTVTSKSFLSWHPFFSFFKMRPPRVLVVAHGILPLSTQTLKLWLQAPACAGFRSCGTRAL